MIVVLSYQTSNQTYFQSDLLQSDLLPIRPTSIRPTRFLKPRRSFGIVVLKFMPSPQVADEFGPAYAMPENMVMIMQTTRHFFALISLSLICRALQFRGIHPTKYSRYSRILQVPLHYSSGASIRYGGILYNSILCTITLQFRGIHPTGPKCRWILLFVYHYITVPGHPSDGQLFFVIQSLYCTITLQFRGIHPTVVLVMS